MGPTKAVDPRNKGVKSVWPVLAGLIQHANCFVTSDALSVY